MDETTYRKWHALHLRVARGETLNAQEQAFYDTELRKMHQEEVLNTDFETLRQMRSRIKELEAENQRLQAQRARMDQEIAALEAQLNEQTKQLLGVGEG